MAYLAKTIHVGKKKSAIAALFLLRGRLFIFTEFHKGF